MKDVPIVINLKAYREAMGENAIRIAKAAEEVYKETGVLIGIAPQYLDLIPIKREVKIPIFAQHVDPIAGRGTGTNSIYELIIHKIDGFILNHSEKKVPLDHIEKALEVAKKENLISIVCASDPEIAEAIAVLEPDIIAVEPPELIGTGIPVSKAKPEIVREAVEMIRKYGNSKVFVGAGISSGEDVKKALELGADGVLLASAVAKAKNPKEKIYDLVRGVLEART